MTSEPARKPWFVRDTGFSEQLDPRDRQMFMRVCPKRLYPRGDTIFRLGDPATSLHVIAEGQVKLVTVAPSGHERILAICGPDDFIGEAFLGEAQHYRVDAVALTAVVTCPMSREQFLELALRAPTFTLSFTEILTSKLFSCREQLSYAYDPIKQRLVRTLLEQAERFGVASGGGWCDLRTELRHDELASIISATRVSVSTAFAELREAGHVEGSRGRYRIHLPSLRALL
jgi:CRP/FNR family transcriptional regulator, cyclic AMP receptor protein